MGRSVLRKEDDRFLRGRGEYVGDIWLDRMQEVAFVRSPVAHARLIRVEIPEQYRGVVFTARTCRRKSDRICSSGEELQAIRAADPGEPEAAIRRRTRRHVRCPSRAEAEDIAQSITLEFEELPAVVDMISACKPDTPLVHDEWSDNRVVEFTGKRLRSRSRQDSGRQDSQAYPNVRDIACFRWRGAVSSAIRMHGFAIFTIISSTQFPHCVQTGFMRGVGNISDGDIRVISPDVGGGFGYKGS